jgi:hypothetical protein
LYLYQQLGIGAEKELEGKFSRLVKKGSECASQGVVTEMVVAMLVSVHSAVMRT